MYSNELGKYIPAYPKVWNIGHPEVENLFRGPVAVEEKVDGSQFSFGFIEGELRFRSKGAVVYPDSPGMFKQAVESVQRVAHFLKPGFIYRGEYLQKPKHNALAYNRAPEGHIVIFDIQEGPWRFVRRPSWREWLAASLNFEVVPRLDTGTFSNVDQLTNLLERESFLGGPRIEGFVVKNYGVFGSDGKPLMGKFVSEQFKEVHHKEWKLANPVGRDILEVVAAHVNKESWWRKSVQHLRDAGEIENSPRDIGKLLCVLHDDVLGEERERIQDALFKWGWPHIARKLSRGFAEWYKQELLQLQLFSPEGAGAVQAPSNQSCISESPGSPSSLSTGGEAA